MQNLQAIATAFFSTSAQVWAALTVFGILAIRDSIQFNEQRLHHCFQFCFNHLHPLKNDMDLHKVKYPRQIFRDPASMNEYLNQENVEKALIEKLELTDMADHEQENLRERISSAIAHNGDYNSHKRKVRELRAELSTIFWNGGANILVSLLGIAFTDWLGERLALALAALMALVILHSLYLLREIYASLKEPS